MGIRWAGAQADASQAKKSDALGEKYKLRKGFIEPVGQLLEEAEYFQYD